MAIDRRPIVELMQWVAARKGLHALPIDHNLMLADKLRHQMRGSEVTHLAKVGRLLLG